MIWIFFRSVYPRYWYPGCECGDKLWFPKAGRNLSPSHWQIRWEEKPVLGATLLMTMMLFSLELAFGFLLLYLRITLGSFDFSDKFIFGYHFRWLSSLRMLSEKRTVLLKLAWTILKIKGISCFYLRRLTIAPVCSLGKFYTKISASGCLKSGDLCFLLHVFWGMFLLFGNQQNMLWRKAVNKGTQCSWTCSSSLFKSSGRLFAGHYPGAFWTS